jgi:hypothetical protein
LFCTKSNSSYTFGLQEGSESNLTYFFEFDISLYGLYARLYAPFLKAYFYDNLIEIAICYVLNNRSGFWRVLVVVLIVNTFSLPFVWFVFPWLTFLTYYEYILLSESFAVISEAILLRVLLMKISWKRALATSFVMNMASFSFGLLFPRLIV